MLTYLVDDRGEKGEYTHFLEAHADRLPKLELRVFTNWQQLQRGLIEDPPALILLDMHF